MTPPRTFMLTLPDGKQRVRCWVKDRDALRSDMVRHGNVYLWKDPGAEVYERVDPVSIQALEMEMGKGTRRL